MEKNNRRGEFHAVWWSRFFGFGALIIVLNIVGCTESPTTDSSSLREPEFTANVSGAVKGEVSALGVVTYLAPQNTVSGTRPGYYIISNVVLRPKQDTLQNREVKGLAITLRIPDGTQPGKYELISGDPMNVGEEFEARLEAMVEGRPISFRSNTEGTLTLDSFSPQANGSAEGIINGKFQFNAENNEGEAVSVNGAFDILAKR